jgi:hypothetical protein
MRVLWGLILVSCTWPCVAGHVYRCPDGSFQDKPCGEGGVVVAKNRPPPQAGGDKACVELGQRAEQVAKLKAQGVPLETVLADIDTKTDAYDKKLDEKKFTVDVYKLGSPTEARVGFEADCVAAKKKAATVPSATVIEQRSAGGGELSPERRAQLEAEHKAQDQAIRDRKCSEYRTDLSELREKQRVGGSASRMESLTKKKRELEQNIADTCV